MCEYGTMDEFCSKILQIYTENGFSKTAVKEICNLTTGHSCVYFTLLNAVLMNWSGLKRCTGTTHIGVRIAQKEIDTYKAGKEFSWLAFVSCTTQSLPEEFDGNCVFQIINGPECQWSPGHVGNNKYVYPCGTQFQVERVEKRGVKMWIYLRLMPQNNNPVLYSKLKSILAKSADRIKAKYSQMLSHHKKYVKESKLKFDLSREQQIRNQTRKIDKREILLKTGKFAYNCSVCKETCHVECNDMKIGLCVSVIDGDTGGCKMCMGKCHYSKHHRQNFKIEITERENEIEVIDTSKLQQIELDLQVKVTEIKQMKIGFYRTAGYLEMLLGLETAVSEVYIIGWFYITIGYQTSRLYPLSFLSESGNTFK